MLQITGNTLDVTVELIGEGRDSFESTTIHLLTGSGADSNVERVRVGRDFPKSALPGKDQKCTLNVVISAYSTRNGAGYRLTALSRADEPLAAAVNH